MKRNDSYLEKFLCALFVLLIAAIPGSALAEQNEMMKQQHAKANVLTGKVTEIINVPSYTYAEVNLGDKKVWAAGPVTPLKVGDQVSFTTGMPMENFYSKSMKREFSVVYFIGQFFTGTGMPATSKGGISLPHAQGKQKAAVAPIKGIDKVEGGYTIADIYSDKAKLKGKALRVRGKVTKFTANVLGSNWIHIRDSSTLEDLTVTTQDTVALDDIVIIEGKLELDKDFNYGYVYAVMLQDAKVIR